MKIRWKIVLTIALAGLTFWLGQIAHCPAHLDSFNGLEHKNLYQLYDGYNDEYFDNKLPKNTVIDWDETGDYMATTNLLPDGRFHIAFNPHYITAMRVARTSMLHEMCHIQTWGELDYQTGRHGPQWRTCMLGLDAAGAWRREMIDYYEGP